MGRLYFIPVAMKPLIAIVNSSSFGKHFPAHLERLGAFAELQFTNFDPRLPTEEIAARLADAHAIIASVTPNFTAETLARLPRLIAIVRHGLGYDNIDVDAAAQLGIIVSRVRESTEQEAVAEHTIAITLAIVRRLISANQAVLQGRWSERSRFVGFELKGKKIGLIGLGNIGSRVAEILALGFRADVMAYDPFLSVEEIEKRHARPVEKQEIFASADIISLHASLDAGSAGIVSAAEFNEMKRGTLLINTARGELVDLNALIDNLRSGKLGGYAADVVHERILLPGNPLLEFENVYLYPHLGAYTVESLRQMGDDVAEDLEYIFVHRSLPPGQIEGNAVIAGSPNWRRWQTA
jgi:phosphoglycerate dehydrogenase-like enzyme